MKAGFSITIDEYGKFTALGRVREKDLFKKNLFAENIGDIIRIFGELHGNYTRFIGNDGVLVGQEKASMINNLENLLSGMISLRFTLAFFYLGTKVPEVENINKDYPYRIVMAGIEYHATGLFKKELFEAAQNFHQWYMELAAPAMKKFLEKVKGIAELGVLSEGAISEVLEEFDHLLHLCFIIEFKMHLTSLNS